VKQKLGAIAYDLPRFLWSMRPSSGQPWVYMHNRDERLTSAPQGFGARCNWQWTSDLHIARVFPALGQRLMNRALEKWPIELRAAPAENPDAVEVSFVIGHRGLQRLPHLLLTLQSIAAQRGVGFECLVVEQSALPEVERHLPSWVQYIHTPLPKADIPYCRSWAFNVGARIARGNVLVMHDNDMLVPVDYSAQLLAMVRDGYEVANLKRFIFYLTKADSTAVLAGEGSLFRSRPESVVQNLEGGGSFGITREAYFAIGGFDESFVGWGGEDNEFWERAQTRRTWPYGYLPLIHIWHDPQPGKTDSQRSTATLFEARSAILPAERIAELTSRSFGNPQFAPDGLVQTESSVLNR
jgi:hypothetical protein